MPKDLFYRRQARHLFYWQETGHIKKRQLSRRRSRHSFLMSIAQHIKSSPAAVIFGTDQRLFHDVFKCLTDAIVASQKQEDTEEKVIEVSVYSYYGFDSLVAPLEGREHYLEKISTLLLCLARLRVYNLPSDSEIIYYREIKKHIRCMNAYTEANGRTKDVQCTDSKDPTSYHRTSVSQIISAVEELIELKDTLAGINTHIWDLNHKNGSAPDVAILVRCNFDSPPEPNRSVEKLITFFYNKLILLLHDLKYSGLADVSPDSREKKALCTLLDYYLTYGSIHVIKDYAMAFSSYKSKPITIPCRLQRERDTMDTMLCSPGGIHRTNGLFYERLFEYVDELRRSCLSFMLKVMEKLGTVVYPENLHRRFGEDAEGIIDHLVNTQKVHPVNSPDYIEGIDQCILLARFASSLIKGISSSVQYAFADLTDMLQRKQHCSEFAPEAQRVLLLLDSGAFRKATDEMETPLAGIGTMGNNVVISPGSSAENLKVLATILQILKDIGALDAFVAPSPQEMLLLEQILEHVSLCIDGFLSTKAYHLERELNLTPPSTLISRFVSLKQHGMFRGMPAAYSHYGGKYLVESLFKRFEVVQEDVELLIPSLQKFKVLMQGA